LTRMYHAQSAEVTAGRCLTARPIAPGAVSADVGTEC